MIGILFTAVSAILLTLINGDAEVVVRFEYYSNPDGTLRNGHCCDGWPFRCEKNGGCDYYFRICLDEEGGTDTTKSCKYGYHRSNKVGDNMNNIVFGDLGNSFGGVTNPVAFSVPDPVDGRNLRLKVDVKEDDRWTKGDYVDYFSEPVQLFKGIYPELHMPVEMKSRTRLLTAVTIRCASNWYGEACTVFCRPPGDQDHYTCDLWTGEKICLPNWSGDECTRESGNNRRHNRHNRRH